MKVAILGAGIAGLMTGHELNAKGYDITVFESLPDIGGLCRTKKVSGGFLFDIGGGHIFHSVYKDILTRMLAFIGPDNVYTHKRNTRIFIYDRFVKYPFENGLSELPPDVRYECLMGYIYAWFQNQSSPDTSAANFHDFILHHFGNGIANHFMIPYNRKIWCVDPSEMGIDWIKNRVPRAPVEDVVKGALGIQTEGYLHQSTFNYPKQGGIQTFVDAIAAPIKHRIRVNTPVVSVSKKGTQWLINGLSFDRVVSTIPLNEFCDLYDNTPADVREKSRQLRHISLLTVLICLKKETLPPYSWIYLPLSEQGEANRLTYFTNYSPALAPPCCTSVLCEATYPGNNGSSVNDAQVTAIVNDLIRGGLIEKESDIISVHHERNKYAYILPDLTMASNCEYILKKLSEPSLDFVGRFGSFRYYNMDQVIKQVVELVENRF